MISLPGRADGDAALLFRGASLWGEAVEEARKREFN
jgi:hypothetical protein